MGTQQSEEITELQAAVEQASEEEKAAAEAEVEEEDDKAVVQKKFAFNVAKQMVEQRQDLITSLKSWVVAGPEVCNTILAATMLLGYAKEDVYPRRKSVLQWEKLKHQLGNALFQGFAKLECCSSKQGIKEEHKLSYIKGLI